MVESIAEDSEKSFGEFFLCKEFYAICFAQSVLSNRFISYTSEFSSLIGKTDTVKSAYWIITVTLVEPFNGKPQRIVGEIFKSAYKMVTRNIFSRIEIVGRREKCVDIGELRVGG